MFLGITTWFVFKSSMILWVRQILLPLLPPFLKKVFICYFLMFYLLFSWGIFLFISQILNKKNLIHPHYNIFILPPFLKEVPFCYFGVFHLLFPYKIFPFISQILDKNNLIHTHFNIFIMFMYPHIIH